ncbi:MAG: phosphopantothenoylcysteine decarboxylase [Planctomycetota bacterium]
MSKRSSMLVTAGPTHEAIDAVRFLANRSSGQMGMAIAQAAQDAGWEVTLLLGPGPSPPKGIRTLDFVSAADLESLLGEHFPECDVLVMAAAVADYRPRQSHPGKLPRGENSLVLELEPTPDLVAHCASRRRPGQRIIAFALEEQAALEQRAAEKLHGKGVDAIVANPLETIGADRIRATILTSDGRRFEPEGRDGADLPMSKSSFAEWLVGWIGRWSN